MKQTAAPLENVPRFDMSKPVKRMNPLLKPVAWALSYPDVIKHKAKINKIGTEGLKPPYLMLCNHNAFLDFKVATAATFPHNANYVVAIDGFIGREWLLRSIGCICKRKFTNDIVLIRQLRRVIKNGDIAALYPEARYSLCGTDAVLPDSLGKLAKLLDVPVVTLITKGHHINSPFWNLHERGNRVECDFKLLLTAEELRQKSVSEINSLIRRDFQYDDFAWQRDNKISVEYEKRAEGLHKVLYQCPVCGTEYRMESKGVELRCTHCGSVWTMDRYGCLQSAEGKGFSHIPDWYEWERENVRREVTEGRYYFESPVHTDSLPNAKKFIPIGKGTLTHSLEGFTLTGEHEGRPYTLHWKGKSLYSCHIEYEYLGKHGDCVDLNTLTDTFYIYPEGRDFAVTKLALATEEIYNHLNQKA